MKALTGVLCILCFGVYCCLTLFAQSGTVYVSPSGSDSTCVRGDSTHPCASFSGAYAKAVGGDTIQIAAGTYGSQNVNSASKGTTVITFQPASGARVVVSG